MKKILTPGLLFYLKIRGYRYLLSRSDPPSDPEAKAGLTLTPVVQKPVLNSLSDSYDTYFKIDKEPEQLAKGIPQTAILVNLSREEAFDYIFTQTEA